MEFPNHLIDNTSIASGNQRWGVNRIISYFNIRCNRCKSCLFQQAMLLKGMDSHLIDSLHKMDHRPSPLRGSRPGPHRGPLQALR